MDGRERAGQIHSAQGPPAARVAHRRGHTAESMLVKDPMLPPAHRHGPAFGQGERKAVGPGVCQIPPLPLDEPDIVGQPRHPRIAAAPEHRAACVADDHHAVRTLSQLGEGGQGPRISGKRRLAPTALEVLSVELRSSAAVFGIHAQLLGSTPRLTDRRPQDARQPVAALPALVEPFSPSEPVDAPVRAQRLQLFRACRRFERTVSTWMPNRSAICVGRKPAYVAASASWLASPSLCAQRSAVASSPRRPRAKGGEVILEDAVGVCTRLADLGLPRQQFHERGLGSVLSIEDVSTLPEGEPHQLLAQRPERLPEPFVLGLFHRVLLTRRAAAKAAPRPPTSHRTRARRRGVRRATAS